MHLITPISPSFPPLSFSSLATTSLFSLSVSLFLFHRYVHLCHILDSTFKYFSFWIPSLSMIISRSIHIAANGIISFFLWLSSIPLYMYSIFFIYSSVSGHLGYFHVLAIVNSAIMNTGVHVSFLIMYLSGHMHKSGIAGSYRSICSFLSDFHTVFHSGYSNSHSHQQP